MTTYSFGDVLLVPFPFTNQSSTKKRPTIVISSDLYNQQKSDFMRGDMKPRNPSLTGFKDAIALQSNDHFVYCV